MFSFGLKFIGGVISAIKIMFLTDRSGNYITDRDGNKITGYTR